MLSENFGIRLRFLRSVLDVTQAELARRLEITPQHVSRIELGRTSPSFPLIEKICSSLNVDPASLFLFPDEHDHPVTDAARTAKHGRLFTWTGLWIITPQSNTHVWSRSVFTLLGYGPYSVKPTLRRFLKHVHPDDRDVFKESFARAVAGELTTDLLFRFTRKGGTQRSGLFRVDPVQTSEKGAGQVIAFLSDVTEWHVLERSLIQNKLQLEEHVRDRNQDFSEALDKYTKEIQRREEVERELRIHERIVSSSCDGHAFIDTRLIFRHVNESYEDIVGLPRESILGRHVADIVGKDFFQNVVRSRITQVLEGEGASYAQWRECSVKGRRYLHVSFTPCREKKEIVGIATTVRDMTELKETEERLIQCEERCRQLEGLGNSPDKSNAEVVKDDS